MRDQSLVQDHVGSTVDGHFFVIHLFIYLVVPCLSCGMWDLVP